MRKNKKKVNEIKRDRKRAGGRRERERERERERNDNDQIRPSMLILQFLMSCMILCDQEKI